MINKISQLSTLIINVNFHNINKYCFLIYSTNKYIQYQANWSDIAEILSHPLKTQLSLELEAQNFMLPF